MRRWVMFVGKAYSSCYRGSDSTLKLIGTSGEGDIVPPPPAMREGTFGTSNARKTVALLLRMGVETGCHAMLSGAKCDSHSTLS